jgi:hypothetical protein
MPEPYDLIYKHAFPMERDMMVISKAWVCSRDKGDIDRCN